MSDRYQRIANSGLGGRVAKRLGLPTPGAARAPRARPAGRRRPGAARRRPRRAAARAAARGAALDRRPRAERGGRRQGERQRARGDRLRRHAGSTRAARLRALYEFFHPVDPRACDRAGRRDRPRDAARPSASRLRGGDGAARRSRASSARWARRSASGATAQLVQVAPGGEGAIESTLRFLLSARSAYVSGQVRARQPGRGDGPATPEDWEQPLAGRVAAVTGAARGIGEAIAEVLARDGAEVVCIDVPAAGRGADRGREPDRRQQRCSSTSPAADAPERARRPLRRAPRRPRRCSSTTPASPATRRSGGWSEEQWDAVLDVNLVEPGADQRARCSSGDVLRAGGSIVAVSSVSGIAGNRGQSNYATSKAGMIGMVDALAPEMRERGATINAVAPGFIETQMTAAMPLGTREAGRRHQQPRPGRPAGRRRRDDRLARRARPRPA